MLEVVSDLEKPTLEQLDGADHSFNVPKKLGISKTEMLNRLSKPFNGFSKKNNLKSNLTKKYQVFTINQQLTMKTFCVLLISFFVFFSATAQKRTIDVSNFSELSFGVPGTISPDSRGSEYKWK